MVFLKANRSGGRVSWYLAHSYLEGGHIRTRYLRALGALTEGQVTQYRRWLSLLEQGPSAVARATVAFEKAKPYDQRRHGVPALTHALFHKLGIYPILLESFAGVKDKQFRSKLVETMVANRLDDPRSKLSLWEDWYPHTSLPFLLNLPATAWDEDDLYETLDVLWSRKDRIERRLWETGTRPRMKGTPVVMKDLTSTYTEGSGAAQDLWMHGYSRDRRPDRRQVNWSLVVTPEGLPVTLEIYPGNTKDGTTVAGTIHRLRTVFGLPGAVFVGDRGMLTEKNLVLLHEGGYHYVVAETLWHEKEALAQAIAKGRTVGRASRVAKTKPLGESWCEVIGKDGRRHIAVFSMMKEAEEKATLEAKLRKGLELEKWARAGLQRGDWSEKNHHELVRSLTRKLVEEDTETLFDVVWDPESIGTVFVRVNEERRDWEERKAGWWMLTTDTAMTGDDVIDLYQSLAVVEHAFRELKSPLRTRPVFHWKDERVCAHLFLCVLSYWLTRWIELESRSKGSKLTAEGALEHLRRVSLDELGIPGVSSRWWAVKELSAEERGVAEALGVANFVADLPKGLA